MARVSVYADDRCTAIFPDEFPAVLTARTYSGTERREEVLHLRGGPARPLSDCEFAQKFEDNAKRVCGAAAVETILERIDRLDWATEVDLALDAVPVRAPGKG